MNLVQTEVIFRVWYAKPDKPNDLVAYKAFMVKPTTPAVEIAEKLLDAIGVKEHWKYCLHEIIEVDGTKTITVLGEHECPLVRQARSEGDVKYAVLPLKAGHQSDQVDTNVFLTLFRKKQCADISLNFEKRAIHAHLAILSARCPKIFEKDFKRIEKSLKKKEMVMVDVGPAEGVRSFFVLEQIIQYIYCGLVDLMDMTEETLVDMIEACTLLSLKHLRHLLTSQLKASLSPNSVFVVLKKSHERKLEDLKTMALQYACEHWDAFLANKNGPSMLGIDLFQEVVATRSVGGDTAAGAAGGSSLANIPPNTLLDDYKAMYVKMQFCDLLVEVPVTGDVRARIPCHRAILQAASDKLGQYIETEKHKFDPEKSKNDPSIIRKNVGAVGVDQLVSFPTLSEKSFAFLLRYLYFGDVSSLSGEVACLLIPFSMKFDLPRVQKICEEALSGSKVQPSFALQGLQLTYLDQLQSHLDIIQLRKACLDCICKDLVAVPLEASRSMLAFEMVLDLLQHYQGLLREGVVSGSSARPQALRATIDDNLVEASSPTSPLDDMISPRSEKKCRLQKRHSAVGINRVHYSTHRVKGENPAKSGAFKKSSPGSTLPNMFTETRSRGCMGADLEKLQQAKPSRADILSRMGQHRKNLEADMGMMALFKPKRKGDQ
mmetsp:Transcript_28853/g.72615  ORF Transcript_28853/g.72615 Transcript_28853/m.72615 type:complete len:660 (-) Transcript_28853:64-2043(-)